MLVLSGGTGTPKLLRGLCNVVPEEDIMVVVNTAEDMWVSGNLVTPDIDTVLYLLSGRLDQDKWWGVKGDTFQTHGHMRSLGHVEKMMLGDLDRATHIMRTSFLNAGHSLTYATKQLSMAMGIRAKVLPMSDDPVSTMLVTSCGRMHFQDFWIANRGEPEVFDVVQEGINEASISPELLECLDNEDDVLIGPSNPISSIGPIINLPGMRDRLKGKNVVAVSPVVGDRPVSGPAGKLMHAKGLPVSSVGVATYYGDILDVFVTDLRDQTEGAMFKDVGCSVVSADTLMVDMDISTELARFVVGLFER